MQRGNSLKAQQQKKSGRARGIAIVLAIVAGIALLIWAAVSVFSSLPSNRVGASLLPCPVSDQVKPFGKYILYYDGLSLHCITDGGSVRWSFQLGQNGGYDCDEDAIAAWTGPNLYILDKNGKPTYNDNLADEIQFARIGKTYVAAVVGSSTTPRLLVKDHTGAHMDEESDAFSTMILLDAGFFGSSGQYMWTLSLDVFGTAANTVLNTFEVGKMNTGETSLGEAITYKILYDNGMLRVINTRRIRAFNERGSEDPAQSMLVYGWRYLDHEYPSRGGAYMLFAPTAQTSSSSFAIRELRVLQSGGYDKRYTLPDTCVGAALWNRTVYAVSAGNLYRAGQTDSRFESYKLPIDGEARTYFGKLSSGKILIATTNSVYCVTLPQVAR